MPRIDLPLDTGSATFAENRVHGLALIAELRALEARTRTASARAQALFD